MHAEQLRSALSAVVAPALSPARARAMPMCKLATAASTPGLPSDMRYSSTAFA